MMLLTCKKYPKNFYLYTPLLEEGIKDFHKAIELNPEFAEAHSR